MAIWVIITASITVFFTLQGGYLYWQYKALKKEQLISQRLAILENSSADAGSLLTDRKKSGLSGILASALEDATFYHNLEAMLEQAGDDTDPASYVLRTILIGFGSAIILGVLTANLGVALLGFMLGFIPILSLMRKRTQRMKAIDTQLPVALEVMMLSLKAGHSLTQTITLSAREMASPLREEFARCAEEHALGRSIEDTLLNMSQRLPACKTLRTFVVAVLVLQQTGGNLIEVIERIIGTLNMQSQYERKLSAMTAEGRSSAKIVGSLPLAFIILGYLADPAYMSLLITHPAGNGILIAALVLWLVGILWTNRMVKPQV